MPLLPFSSAPIQATAVTPGSYTNLNATVNKYGQITAATNGSAGGVTVNTTNIKIDQTPAGSTYGLLAGTVNGSTTLFTVSNGSYQTGTLTVFLNDALQVQGAGLDWVETTPASGTFTFAIAPPTGSVIAVMYTTPSSTSGGSVPVSSGGTGATSLTGVLIGNGTSAVTGVTTSSGIAAALSDETGTGSLVFGTAPTISGMTISDATNVILGSTTGTQIGTASTQKLAFYGVTPVVKPANIPPSAGNITSAQATINAILTLLQSLGLMT